MADRNHQNAIRRASYRRNRDLLGDQRTIAARRLREIAEAIALPWGGLDCLGEGAHQVVWAGAALGLKAEYMQAALRDGKEVDAKALIDVANALTRTIIRLEALQSVPKGARKARTLADVLAGGANG